ncbi:MAG: alpha-amylase [Lachnospiraceae bacterium]|nr:alpha-amylase [Lachnospiraceae bacterium]
MNKKVLGTLLSVAAGSVILVSCKKDEPKKTEDKSPKVTAEVATEEKSIEWAKNAVFYEIFVRAFYDSDGDGIGDFRGVAEKTDYLKELGVDAVWLMPMMETTTYHGYDVVDYYKTNPDYGSMDDFKYMLDTLHQNNIKVVIDYVANHTSNKNEWFVDAINKDNSPYRDYYSIYDEIPELPNMKVLRRDADTGKLFIGYFDVIMPDLNYKNQKVRDEMKKVADYWLDIGIDGFRLDGAMHIDDDDMDVTFSWWKEFTEHVKEKDESAFIVGENWSGSYKVISQFYKTMDSSFDFPMCSMIESLAGGKPNDAITIINNELASYEESASDSDSVVKEWAMSTMINNHDMERIASRLSDDTNAAKVAANLLLTFPGTPFLYYGDELGQTGRGTDIYKRESFDWYKAVEGKGFASKFGVEGTPLRHAIADDGISYEEEKDDENSIYNRYRNLIKMRKNNKEFFTGKYESLGVHGNAFAYTISGDNEEYKIAVVHNVTTEEYVLGINSDCYDLYNETDLSKTDAYTIKPQDMLVIKYTGEMPLLFTEQED